MGSRAFSKMCYKILAQVLYFRSINPGSGLHLSLSPWSMVKCFSIPVGIILLYYGNLCSKISWEISQTKVVKHHQRIVSMQWNIQKKLKLKSSICIIKLDLFFHKKSILTNLIVFDERFDINVWNYWYYTLVQTWHDLEAIKIPNRLLRVAHIMTYRG